MTPDDLKAWREQAGLSQSGLARLLDVPPNTVARWERGATTIRHPHLLRLALERLNDTQIGTRSEG